jgi:hypothetical protein
VQPRRQHWFLNEKSGFPFRTLAFCSVSRGRRRLGEKEYRAPSGTPGVALRPRTQAGPLGGLGPRPAVGRGSRPDGTPGPPLRPAGHGVGRSGRRRSRRPSWPPSPWLLSAPDNRLVGRRSSKLRVATGRKEGRVANGAELEKDHRSVTPSRWQDTVAYILVQQ